MLFTTRDPREAEAFVNKLPFSPAEKQVIRGHFEPMSNLMEEMKKNKSFNSKGGERWFVSRTMKKVQEAQERALEDMLNPDPNKPVSQRSMFLQAQSAFMLAVIEVAQECKCTPNLIQDLMSCMSETSQLIQKYTQSPEENLEESEED